MAIRVVKGYVYGMRLRGFSPGCQPMIGLVDVLEGVGEYYNMLVYIRELTKQEIEDYELDRIEVKAE